MKILLCYVSGLDRRRVDAASTPFLWRAFDTYCWAELQNLPSNELLPTILTGVYPQQHGVWGVRLRPGANGGARKRWVDFLPDLVTTSVQCAAHLLTGEHDLAAIPPHRRRKFEITRTKYVRRKRPHEVLGAINGFPSLLGVLGPDSRYVYSNTSRPARSLLSRVGNGEHALEVLELYSLDRYQQWNLQRDRGLRRFYRTIDAFIERLGDKCRAHGVTLIVLSDHGHEAVIDSIDLKDRLRRLGLDANEYSYFLELPIVRFWFHSGRARERILDLLEETDDVRLCPPEELARYGLALGPAYGEAVAVVAPGRIFFPHDFHQPLANLWLGLTDAKQLPRVLDPRQRSNHGYLPHNECERGAMLVLDHTWRALQPRMALVDVAPSILRMLDVAPPGTMTGAAIFAPASASPRCGARAGREIGPK
jgi:hypothetical protein